MKFEIINLNENTNPQFSLTYFKDNKKPYQLFNEISNSSSGYYSAEELKMIGFTDYQLKKAREGTTNFVKFGDKPLKNDFRNLNEKTHTKKQWDLMIKSLHRQKTKVPEWVYYYFLEVLPPIYSKQTGFLVGEPDSHDSEGNAMRLWFYGTPKTGFYGELVNEKHHIKNR